MEANLTSGAPSVLQPMDEEPMETESFQPMVSKANSNQLVHGVEATTITSSSMFKVQRHERAAVGWSEQIVSTFSHLRRGWKRNRRKYLVLALTVQLAYLVISIPLRFGLFFDPFYDLLPRSNFSQSSWTSQLTALTICDVLAEIIAVFGIFDLFDSQRRAIAERAHLQSRELFDLQRNVRRKNTKELDVDFQQLDDETSTVWTLGTILPLDQQRRRQIRGALLLETIAILPVEFLCFASSFNLLHVLRVFKLLRLYRTPDFFREARKHNAHRGVFKMLSKTGMTFVFQSIFVGIVLCHWMACGLLAVAHFECGMDLNRCEDSVHEVTGKTCWALHDQLKHATNARRYARALYWASRTIITAGFNDVTPVTNTETLYVVMVEVIGAVFSTSLIASFLFLFRYQNQRNAEFHARVDKAKEYMQLQKIPQHLKENVMDYFHHVWEHHRGLRDEDILDRLPEHLRVTLESVLKTQRLLRVPFLAKESIEFINTLSKSLAPITFSPNDRIIEQKSEAMYFIVRGVVVLQHLDASKSRQCGSGDFFAEACLLFPEHKSEEKAHAVTFCEIYQLRQCDFLKTLALFHRKDVLTQLDRMKSVLININHQKQKMKRVFGMNQTVVHASVSSNAQSIKSSRGSVEAGVRISRVSVLSTPIIHDWRAPGSRFRRNWKRIRWLCLLFVAFDVPLYIVFNNNSFPFYNQSKFQFESILSVVVEIFFIVDFALRCRVFSYFEPMTSMVIQDPVFIFENYRDKGFWYDLSGGVPIALVLQFAPGNLHIYETLFRLLRLLRLHDFLDVCKDVADMSGLDSKSQRAIALILSVTYSLHLSSCMWFAMSRIGFPTTFVDLHGPVNQSQCLYDAAVFGNCTWTVYDCYTKVASVFPVQDPSQSLYDAPFAYLRSIYWSIVALTTVGYGDITPFSTYETCYAAMWTFIGGIINYAALGAMSSIIANLTAQHRQYSEQLNLVNRVMAHYHVSEDIRHQIRKYHQRQFEIKQASYESDLLAHLPHRLGKRISWILHADSVHQVPLFHYDVVNQRIIYDLAALFRNRIFHPGDSFFMENNECKEMFVIERGKVDMFYKNLSSGPFGALCEGDYYGVNEMILGKSHSSSLVAASMAHVAVIGRDAFMTCMTVRYPKEFQKLKKKALDDYRKEALRQEAVCENLKTSGKLASVLGMKNIDVTRTSLNHSPSRRPGRLKHNHTLFLTRRNPAQSQNFEYEFRLYWNCLIAILNIYNGFEIIFRICFLSTHFVPSWEHKWFIVMNLSSDWIMACDIYLRLYYFGCEGDFSNLYKRTHRNNTYAHTRLIRDLWTSLPLYYLGQNAMIMSICRLPRLIRLMDMPQMTETLVVQIQQRVSSAGNVASYVSPVKQLLMLLFAAHWAACIFYLVSREEDNPNMWIQHDTVVHQEHGSVGVLYLRSFYWALTTLTLVGSEEVVPIRTYGTIWAAITCLCCTFVVGDIVGTLSELILEMDKNKKELQEKAKAFEEFAKNHNLPSTMRTRVLHFLKFQNFYRRGFDLQKFRSDLSPNLQVQLMLDLYGDTLASIPIAPMLIKQQVSAMAVRLQSELFIPGDNVVNGGDLGHKLYILKSGSAIVLWKNTSTIVGSIISDMMFGEVAFFLTGKRRCATVQTTTCCEILVLDRKSWDEVLLSCRTGEGERCEREILDWVRKRLKVYNSMAMEIIHDIQLALSEESQLLRRFKNQPPTLNRSSMSTGRTHEAAASQLELRRITRNMVENTVRHLLRDIEHGEHKAKDNREKLRRLSMSKQKGPWWRKWLPGGNTRTRNGRARVYADGLNDERKSMLQHIGSSDRLVQVTEAPALRRRQSSRFRPAVRQGRRSIAALEDRTLHAINPLRSSIRGIYDRDALQLMEKECWHGHRTTILMELTAIQPKFSPQDPAISGPRGSMTPSVFNETETTLSLTPLPRRNSDLEVFKRNRHISVANNAQNLLSATTTTSDDRRITYSTLVDIRSVQAASLPNDAHLGRKKLVRSRSLPFFDAKFAQELEQAMEQERLQASLLEAQTWCLNYELLQRYRRPEVSTMFVLYNSLQMWIHKAHRWILHRFSKSKKLPSHNGRRIQGNHPIKPEKLRPTLDSVREEEKRELTVSEDFEKLSSRISRAWETLMVLVAMFYAIMIPYMVCFGSDSTSFPDDAQDEQAFARYMGVVDTVNALCILDYVMKHRFNVGSSADGDIAQKVGSNIATSDGARKNQRSQKWKHHMFEFLTSMPFDLLVRILARHSMEGHEWLYQALFQLPKLFRLGQAQESILRISLFLTYDLRLPVDEAMLRFGRSIVTFCLAGHWIACIWFAISLHSLKLHPHYSWLITPGMLPVEPIESLHEVSLRRKYIRSLHFAVGSISTVFYGDIASQNLTETFAELAVILCSIFIYGILVGAHGERIEAHFKKNATFEQNMAELYHFVVSYEVPRDVQQRLKLYFRNTWLKTHGRDENEGVEGLSTLLMEEITSYTLRSMASKVQIFQNCDDRFLRALLVCLKQVICSHSEQVVRQGDIDRSMYLIAAGRILVKGAGFELIKEEGDLFGELSLLYGVPRSATCISLGTSMLYVLEWNTYERLLQDFPEYRIKNRRDWVLSSIRSTDPRFRAVIGIVATMDKAHWVQVEEIIRKARSYRTKRMYESAK